MTILKELCVAAGSYQSNGQDKTKWVRIGHLHATKDGSKQYITLDPAYNLAAFPKKEGDDRLYVNMFEPKPKEGAPARTKPAPADDFDPSMDVPF